MINLRKYGKSPYSVAVIHGGPGATGEMEPVAQELSKNFGVLEPLQTKDSIDGQIEELKNVLEENASLPVTLIGHSWGAWLSWIFAAKYPAFVKKIILVSSGPFEEKYVNEIMETRLRHLDKKEQKEAKVLLDLFNNSKEKSDEEKFSRFGELMEKADSYDSINLESGTEIISNPEIYQKVWPEANNLRKSGELLELGKKIRCEVTVIHGDYDSHPARDVEISLNKVLKNFKFILLSKCGHTPWKEKFAREKFFEILKNEIL